MPYHCLLEEKQRVLEKIRQEAFSGTGASTKISRPPIEKKKRIYSVCFGVHKLHLQVAIFVAVWWERTGGRKKRGVDRDLLERDRAVRLPNARRHRFPPDAAICFGNNERSFISGWHGPDFETVRSYAFYPFENFRVSSFSWVQALWKVDHIERSSRLAHLCTSKV